MIEIFGMNLIDFLIYYNISMIIAFIGYKIFRSVRDKDKVRVEVLTPTHQYYDKKFKTTTDSKFKFDKDTNPNFSPISFFRERKSKWVFWRLPRFKLLYVKGMQEVINFKEKIDDISELRWTWSNEEMQKYIKKLIAKAKAEVKPISRFEFIVLALLLMVIIVFQIILLNRMRVF